MTDKEIIKNAHCKYFEGQTGLCQAKEFKRCNPINCKLYIIDELSTILDLQEQLQCKEQECEELKAFKTKILKPVGFAINPEQEVIDKIELYKQALEKIEESCKNICENCGNKDTKWCNNDCDVFNELTIINEVKDAD